MRVCIYILPTGKKVLSKLLLLDFCTHLYRSFENGISKSRGMGN